MSAPQTRNALDAFPQTRISPPLTPSSSSPARFLRTRQSAPAPSGNSPWIAIFVFWRNYRIDKFRDQLFALRNELFDYAAQGGVSFDEPAYGILRNTMNGLLRYAERISFTHAILANVVQRFRPSPVYQNMFQR